METEDIIKSNKLIAEFMGWGNYNDRSFHTPYEDADWCNGERTSICDDRSLKFHSSWDWLMPVVDKIESIIFNKDNSFNVTIGSTNFCVIQDSNGEVYESIEDYRESKLLTTYVAVTEFIKWYNEQLKENECSTN